MSSEILPIIASNATYALDGALPALEAGKLSARHMPIVWNAFRARGICEFLLSARADDLCLGLHKSAAAYLHFLTCIAAEDEKATSCSQPLFDAIACADWNMASAIANASRTTVNPACEHEEDFMYAWFIVQYVRGAPADELSHMLALMREIVVDMRSRLDVCMALLERQWHEFERVLVEMTASYEQIYVERLGRGLISEEQWAVESPLFVEGMALLRLAERAGFHRSEDYPLIPSLAMPDDFPAYRSDDWRQG